MSTAPIGTAVETTIDLHLVRVGDKVHGRSLSDEWNRLTLESMGIVITLDKYGRVSRKSKADAQAVGFTLIGSIYSVGKAKSKIPHTWTAYGTGLTGESPCFRITPKEQEAFRMKEQEIRSVTPSQVTRTMTRPTIQAWPS